MGAAPLTPSWHAERTPDAPAIIMGSNGETVTYAQLEDRSARMARALRARGLAEGDTIAICMENSRPFIEAAWAAQRSGLRYTAINCHLRPAEVQYILDDCGAVALVSSATMADVIGRLDLSVIPVLVSAVGDLPGFERYADLLATTPPGPPPASSAHGGSRPPFPLAHPPSLSGKAGRCCTRRARRGGRRGCARSFPTRRSATRRRHR